ncbi:RNA methyltransferase [Pseudarthrobacter sp. PS3-L1]|uniref:TrmH family RNA methyltransferase n=1 Tax=Pseudarthrobacter sp. PS3-L1 TaxID=3046207 RepID=UPI0024B8EE87|nr:RNA methyltransferase [Pseudarthrobacter sp. PS3-L1]MDJ0320189.1 RNA methyltransferase [Pseudarthrobacter sp. PS3-L1]
MPFHYLESAADPRVSDYTNLTDVHLRKLREPAEGLYIAESSRVLRRALAAGHQPRSFFLAEKWADDLADVFDQFPDVPAYVGSAQLLEEITGFHLHRGAMAAMHRPAPLALADLLSGARRVAVLEDIVDHTNVGAIFRSAAALDIDAVLISPRCGDPLYRRSVRVSMGTVFQVPWVRLGQWPQDLEVLRSSGFTVAALELTDDAVDVDVLAASQPERLALVLGTEGAGMSPATLAAVDCTVRIPMRAGVDSLNVAAASAVAFWELRPRT